MLQVWASTATAEGQEVSNTLECKFSCELCGVADAVAFVPVRKTGQEVTDWMEKVCIPAICEAHFLLSRDCRPKQLTNLMIPIYEDAEGIGFWGTVPVKP